MATQLVLVQSLGVRVLPSEQEAVSTTVATMTAAQALSGPRTVGVGVVQAPFV